MVSVDGLYPAIEMAGISPDLILNKMYIYMANQCIIVVREMKQNVSPKNIIPLNGVTVPENLAKIVASMTENGWVGDPIVVVPCGEAYQALTGSHRIEAAMRAGLETIPVELVESDRLTEEQWSDLDIPKSTVGILSALEGYVEAGAEGLDAAIVLLQAEVEKENWGWEE